MNINVNDGNVRIIQFHIWNDEYNIKLRFEGKKVAMSLIYNTPLFTWDSTGILTTFRTTFSSWSYSCNTLRADRDATQDCTARFHTIITMTWFTDTLIPIFTMSLCATISCCARAVTHYKKNQNRSGLTSECQGFPPECNFLSKYILQRLGMVHRFVLNPELYIAGI